MKRAIEDSFPIVEINRPFFGEIKKLSVFMKAYNRVPVPRLFYGCLWPGMSNCRRPEGNNPSAQGGKGFLTGSKYLK